MKKTWKCALAMMLSLAMAASSFSGFAAEVKAAETGDVTVVETTDGITIGNGYISREFSTAESKLSTVNITNKRTDGGDTVFTPAEGSEEFIIKVTKEASEPIELEALDRTGWTATADSYHNASGDNDGPASNLLDGRVESIWHTNYGGGTGDQAYPYNVVITLNGSKTFNCFSYTPRHQGEDTNGNVLGYELWASTASETLAVDAEDWTKIAEGNFKYDGTNPIYVNLEEECTATQVKFVATSAKNGANFAGGAEFNLHPEAAPVAVDDRSFAASDLTLTGVEVEDTTATINNLEKTGKKVTFSFEPYTYEYNSKKATWTINEVIVMYDGDHYMRKFMEIKEDVAEGDTGFAIDYIDLESFNVNDTDVTWTIPTDKGGVVAMDQFKANLGQPIYINGMFFGCEFPETDTEIVNGNGYMRYYTGKTFERFEADNQLTTDGKYVTWQTVAGAARSTDNQVIQADFYEYIYDIATPSDFRIQYNSWFDNMMKIDDNNILESFIEIDRQLNAVETRPLNSYVVDDGWNAYNNGTIGSASHLQSGAKINETGFWEFNEKFPEGLTPSSELVHKFGSNFGVWIGPRGGYNFYGTLADILTASGKGSKAGGSVDVADRTYVEEFTKMACKWQDDYDVNYWKWDGFADGGQYGAFAAQDGVPGYANRHMTGGFSHMYHVTDLWEAWIDLMEAVRANAEENNIPKLWISLTCYVNPSPWFLQWANSVWMQCVYDQKDAGFGLTKLNKQLTYRDAMYYDFVVNHQFQFPLMNLYNHDPIYGKEGTGMNINTATDDDFQNYLYAQSGRGTAFWELYFSDSIMTDGKYEVTSEFLAWAEENYHMLKNSKFIGGMPDNTLLSNGTSSEASANAYGYSCFDGTDGLLFLRNSHSSEAKTITFTFDRTMGVAENAGTLKYHVEHTYRASENLETTGELTYGETYEITLQPNESRILRVSAGGDTTSPEFMRAYSDGDKVVTVKFNEKVTGTTFTVSGAEVETVEAAADDVTFRITLTEALADGEVTVTAEDVADKAGNSCTDTISFVHNTGNIVTERAAAAADSLNSNYGFTVAATVEEATAGTVVAQGDAYALGLTDELKAAFTVNGATAVSNEAVEAGATIVGVKENNGILKLYVNGTLAGAAYKAENRFYQVTPAAITVNNATEMRVLDTAYGYDLVEEVFTAVESLQLTPENVTASSVDTTEPEHDKSAANAVDGDANTFWATVPSGTLADASYIITLDDVYTINQVDYTKRYDSGAGWNCTGNLFDYVISVSTDGEVWTQVAAGDTVDGTTNITFDPVEAKYVKLTATQSYHWDAASVNTVMTVAELAVFKAPAPEAVEISPEVLAENALANSEQWPAQWTNDGKAAWAFDDEEHWWHSRYEAWDQKFEHEIGSAKGDGKPSESNPIWIQTGFDDYYAVDHITYTGRNNGMGLIKDYKVSVACLEDPTATPVEADFKVVKTGVLEDTTDEQEIQLDAPETATHVRITVTSTYLTHNSDGHVAAQNISVFGYEAKAPEFPEVDKTALTAAITAAGEKVEADYTADTWAVFQDALTKAQEVAAKTDATQEEVTAAAEALEEAIEALEKAATPEPATEVCEIFKDVLHDAWYEEAIQYVYDAKIMTGTGETAFEPETDVTRAMVIETLYKMDGRPDVSELAAPEVVDYQEGAWWADALKWAMANGIATGDANTKAFNAEQAVTREQLATFLYRYAGYKGLDTTLDGSKDEILGNVLISNWAETAFTWAVEEELITGFPVEDGFDFAPQRGANRAQLATILMRFIEK